MSERIAAKVDAMCGKERWLPENPPFLS